MFRVIEELAIMEGRSRKASTTKPAAPFNNHGLLKVYWHKHYNQAAYMAQNIQIEMGRDRTVNRVMTEYIGQDITPEIINRLVYAVVQENYLNRSRQGRLTGEWIVFQKTPAGNVYLSLASHQEDDKALAERLAVYQTLDLITSLPPDGAPSPS